MVFCVLIIWLPTFFPLYLFLSMPVSQNVLLFFSWCHTFPDCSFPVFLNSFSYPLLICRDPLSWTTRAYYHASTPCSFFLPLNADSGDRTHVLCLQGNHFTGLNFLVFFLLGQHCLDPDAYILDVYHINPHAEWVIKPSPSL